MKGYAVFLVFVGICALSSANVLDQNVESFLVQEAVREYLEDGLDVRALAEKGCVCSTNCVCTAPIGENKVAEITIEQAACSCVSCRCIKFSVAIGGQEVFSRVYRTCCFRGACFTYNSQKFCYHVRVTTRYPNYAGMLYQFSPERTIIGNFSFPLQEPQDLFDVLATGPDC